MPDPRVQPRVGHGPSGPEDRALVAEVLRGQREALGRLAERLRCVPRILAFLDQRNATPLGRDVLSDLAQDVAVLVWRKLEEFEGLSPLEGWVHGFCVREYWNAARREQRLRHEARVLEQRVRGGAGESDPDPWAFEELHEALRRIGREEARILRLKHFEGWTFDEIGASLGIPVNTAKTRYYRGLSELKAVLRPEGEAR